MMMDLYLIGSLRLFIKLDMASHTLQLPELNLSVCCTQGYVSCTHLYHEHDSEYNTVSYNNLTTTNLVHRLSLVSQLDLRVSRALYTLRDSSALLTLTTDLLLF